MAAEEKESAGEADEEGAEVSIPMELVLQRFSHGPDSWRGLLQYRAEYQNGKQGLLNPDDRDALFAAALQVPSGGLIVEIGSFRGCSTVHLAAGAKLVGARPVVAIDPFRPNNGGEQLQYPWYWQEFVQTIQRCGLEDMVIPVATYSQYAKGLLTDESVDLLFIDGDHSADGVMRDYAFYATRVKPGGTILFHDATYPPIAAFLGTLPGAEPVTELIAKVRK